jgi:hypothetical protein
MAIRPQVRRVGDCRAPEPTKDWNDGGIGLEAGASSMIRTRTDSYTPPRALVSSNRSDYAYQSATDGPYPDDIGS